MNTFGMNDEVKSNINLLTAWIESRIAYKNLPGIAIGIIYDQEMIWSRGFGYADVENKKPVTPQTLFRIASITKLFTSTALLQLRDAGKLQLDDPVVKYLPWFSIQQEPDSPPILLKHLITHTSGLPRESASPYWDTAEFPSYEEVEKTIANQEQVWRAGTRWKYSNLAVSLAGDAVAAASGMPYEDYIEQCIFQPLGMMDTYIRTLPQDHPLFAVGYGRRMPDGKRSLRPFGDCKGITPAANIATNLNDLAKFAMLQFGNEPVGGKQIISKLTLEEMHSVQWLDTSWEFGWGWGFQVMRKKGKTFVGHGGSLMGFRTNLLINPEEKIAVIVLTNADDGEPSVMAEKAYEWVAPSVIKQFGSKPEKKEANPAWQKLTGRYRSPWGDMQIMIYQNELIAIDPTQDDPLLSCTKLIPVTGNKFRMEVKDGFEGPGEKTVFELDEQGKVIRIVTGESYSYPIENW